MSKKDKKRIAELERQQSILAATIRVMRKHHNYLSRAVEQDGRANAELLADIIQSRKEQTPTEQFRKCRGGIKCNNARMPEPNLGEAKQEEPQQANPATTEKEQELLAQLNAGLAKFSSLETFNEDRKNKFLPPVGRLEFHKMKSAIECSFAIAKMVRPDLYDKIDQIKIPEEKHGETEQRHPENACENLGEPVLNKPVPQKAALNKIVLGRIKEIEKLLANPNLGTVGMALFIHDCANDLQLDLADFRRKVLDLGAVKPSKVEPKEAEQDSPTLSELEHGKVWIIQTNPKKAERLNAFYLEKVSAEGLVIHTPNQSEALQFSTAMEAEIKTANIISCAQGGYKADDFKIVPMKAK